MNLLLSCIGRRGHVAEWFREVLSPNDRIVGTSNTRWTPGFHACDVGVVLPDIHHEREYIETLLEVCAKEKIDALLSFFDRDADVIARNRQRFVDLDVVPVIPDATVTGLCLDKLMTQEFLQRHEVPTARTFSGLEAALAAVAAGRVVFPLVVKERWGFASRSLHYANDEAQLRAFYSLAPDLIIQEKITGDEHSLDVLNDLNGRVLSVIVKRKIAMRSGETDQAVTVHHAEAIRLGRKLGSLLGHVGPLDVDFFIHANELTVLDINPRFGGAYGVAHLAGADFPRKIISLLRGELVEPDVGMYEAGVEMMKEPKILGAYEGPLVDERTPDPVVGDDGGV